MLEQIRRLRALVAQQKADYEAQLSVLRSTIAEMHNATEPLEVQAELDAFEAELTPPNPGGAAVGEGLPTVAEVAANDPAN